MVVPRDPGRRQEQALWVWFNFYIYTSYTHVGNRTVSFTVIKKNIWASQDLITKCNVRILTEHGESQGSSHRRKAERHAGMKSVYSGSWSLYEFMDSRAEKWMSIDWVLQDQHWGRRVWIWANRSRSLLWDCVLVMSEAIAIKPHQHGYLNMTWMRTTAIKEADRGKPNRCLSKEIHVIWLANTRWSET